MNEIQIRNVLFRVETSAYRLFLESTRRENGPIEIYTLFGDIIIICH